MSETIQEAASAGTSEEIDRAVMPQESAAEPNMDDGGEQAEQPEQEAPEEEEYKFGARAVKVPKGAVPEPIAQALREFAENAQRDYTQKTMDVAEQRKAIEAERETLAKVASLSADEKRAQVAAETFRAHAQALVQQLPALWQSDPDKARQMSDEARLYEIEANRQEEALKAKQAEIATAFQQHQAKLIEANRAAFAKRVQGFDDNAERELVSYAVKSGIPENQAKAWALNPTVAQWAWNSMLFERQAAALNAAKAPAKASEPPAPVKAVAGSVKGRVSDDQLSDEEYFRREMKRAAEARRPRR